MTSACTWSRFMSNMPETKTETVRRLVADGRYPEALRIANGFRIGIVKSDLDKIRRAHECFSNSGFYASIGFDPEKVIADGIDILKSIYSKGE